MNIRKYRKRLVIISAMHYTGTPESQEALKAFVNPRVASVKISSITKVATLYLLEAKEHRVIRPSDYVVQGIHGCYYPVFEHIFKELYENVDPEETVVEKPMYEEWSDL